MADIASKTYYELLGVAPEATKDQIKAAYKEIARIFHPDSHYYDEILGSLGAAAPVSAAPKLGSESEETFKVITAAYNVLINDQERAKYDAILPKGLTTWEEDPKEEWQHSAKLFRPAPTLSSHPEGPKSAYAYGTFGRVANEDQESSFEDQNLRPVSEMLASPRWGLLRRLLSIFSR